MWYTSIEKKEQTVTDKVKCLKERKRMIKLLTYLMVFLMSWYVSNQNITEKQNFDIYQTKIEMGDIQSKSQDEKQEQSTKTTKSTKETKEPKESLKSKKYSDENLYVLSHVIFGEAGRYSEEL